MIVEIVDGDAVAARELDDKPPIPGHPEAQAVRPRVIAEGMSVEAAPDAGAQLSSVCGSADSGQQNSDFGSVTRKDSRRVSRQRQSLDAFVCEDNFHFVSIGSEMRRQKTLWGFHPRKGDC